MKYELELFDWMVSLESMNLNGLVDFLKFSSNKFSVVRRHNHSTVYVFDLSKEDIICVKLKYPTIDLSDYPKLKY